MTKRKLQKWTDENIPARLRAELREDEATGDLFLKINPAIEMRVPELSDERMVLRGIEGLLNAIIGECIVTASKMRSNANQVHNTIMMPQLYTGGN